MTRLFSLPFLILLLLLAGLLGGIAPVSTVGGVDAPSPGNLAYGPASTPRIRAELVPMTTWAVPGSTLVVAVRQEIAPGWHTYWRNPGDSGGATTLRWRLPDGARASDIVWPVPERQRLQSLMNYGYSGQVYLPVPIEVPANAVPGSRLPLQVEALFLVCSDDMCVPDTLTLGLDIPVQASAPPLNPDHGAAIADVLAQAPRPAAITAHIGWQNGQLLLSAADGPLAGHDPGKVWFFPNESGRLDHAAPQPGEWGPQGLRLHLTASPQREPDTPLMPLAGVLATDLGAFEILAEPGPILPGTRGRGDLPDVEARPNLSGLGMVGLIQTALFALIGGLILNLMPCVFPVLAMKVAALTRAAHDRQAVRRDGLAYLAGVITTFVGLALVLISVRAAGEAVGWGFQLQVPGMTAGLALLMLAVGMNLSGVYAVSGAAQGLAMGKGRHARLPEWVGAFLTGVLAVVVAAPCTAPFMAVALGTALTLPWYGALIVFAMLGLGLALPFVLASFSPGLLSHLPRPGPWMERLRHLLALPMYGTALWLGWVFSRQVAPTGLIWLVVAGLALGLALILWGRVQRGPARRPGWIVGICLGLILSIGAGVLAVRQTRQAGPVTAVQDVEPGETPLLPSQPWSQAAVQNAVSQGRPVLVNFTADWCVTCKINERTSLSSPRVRHALAETGTVYLVGDWTRRDAAIARELERHGRSGVPLYLLYKPGETSPRILPQLLTEGLVIEALNADPQDK